MEPGELPPEERGGAVRAGESAGGAAPEGGERGALSGPGGSEGGAGPLGGGELTGRQQRRLLKKKRKRVERGAAQDPGDYFDVYGPDARAEVVIQAPDALLEGAWDPQRTRPVTMKDVQQLLLWVLAQNVSPDWVFVKNKPLVGKVVVVLAGGLDADLFHQYRREMPRLRERLGAPAAIRALEATIPPSVAAKHLFTVGSGKGGRTNGAGRTALGLQRPLPRKPPLPAAHYTLTREQMEANEYPMPVRGTENGALGCPEGFLATQPGVVTPRIVDGQQDFGILGVDCEMCSTERGLELTQVIVVDEHSRTVYEKLVRPPRPILDYNTRFSGITAEMMEGVTTTLEEVQQDLLKIIDERTVLVGHSLENDLRHLRLVHPNCIDTAILYTHPRGPPYKSSLRYLAERHLGRQIQKDNHECTEDAVAALELALLKVYNGPHFAERQFRGHSLIRILDKNGHQCSLQDRQPLLRQLVTGNANANLCSSDQEALTKTVKEIQSGAAKLVWTQFTDLYSHYENQIKERMHQAWKEGTDWRETEKLKVILSNLDDRIAELYDSAPGNTLFVVATGCGNSPLVRRLQQQKLQRTRNTTDKSDDAQLWSELDDRELVKEQVQAGKAMCFINVK